jgi:hypothetical protein
MKSLIFILSFLIVGFSIGQSNLRVSDIVNAPADPSSVLEVESTTKGMLVPRMTSAQRLAIASPANGLLVYDTDVKCFSYFVASSNSWNYLCNTGIGGANTILTSQVPPGPNCSSGGILVQFGNDANGNGQLDPSEINSTLNQYVCNGAAGSQGTQGPPGATGVAGPQGAQGLQGPPGATGAAGPQGPQGNPGSNGINCWDLNGNGSNDLTEDVNGDGSYNSLDCAGIAGAAGPQGSPGATGPQGPPGATGAQGPPGATGPQGIQGPAGSSGSGWNITSLTMNSNGQLTLTTDQPQSFSTTSNAWLTTGNIGTIPSTNFLGTIDNQDLVLRTNNTERVRVTNGGNVGVGGYPNTKLDVSNGSDGLAIGQVHGDNTHTIQTYIDGQWANRSTYASGCCNKLLLQPDAGEVAIGGSTNPTAKLEINLVNPNGWGGNAKATRIFSPDNNFFLDLNTYVIGGGNIGYHFSPNNNNGLVIATNGNVGIGTTNPSEKLQINSSVNSTFVRMNDGTRTFDIRFGDSFQGHNNSGGIVYYEVNGNETHMFGGPVYPDNNGGRDLGGSGFRWGTVFANNGTINTSDLRLKKDIQPTFYGLKEVLQMRPVSYLWKDIAGSRKLGFIAQELQQLIPEVVSIGNDENKTLGVFYSDLIPVLTKAIQEQQVLIETLQREKASTTNELNLLKEKNANTTSELNNLKAEIEWIKAALPKAEKN